jgi:hypothetical protein
LVLDINQLKAWDRWDNRASAFLDERSSDIRVADVLGTYAEVVQSFYEWFDRWNAEVYAAAFLELDELQGRLKRLVDGLPGT